MGNEPSNMALQKIQNKSNVNAFLGRPIHPQSNAMQYKLLHVPHHMYNCFLVPHLI